MRLLGCRGASIVLLGLVAGVVSADPPQDRPPTWDATPPPGGDDTGLLQTFITGVAEGLKWFVEAVLCFFVGLIDGLIISIFDMIPEGWAPATQDAAYWYEVVNAWVPLDLIFALLGLFWVFLFFFVIVKFIWKAIPFGTG